MTLVVPAGVKRTTGGAFDAEAPFTFFLASNPSMFVQATGTPPYPTVLVAVNEVCTARGREVLDQVLDSGCRVMLDSGIFNLAMEHVRAHHVSHDVALGLPPEEIDGFEALWDLYGEIVTTYADRLWGVVELDQGGVENKPRTRARIEKEFGITPMPVYHPLLDGWDYYDTLARSYDRLCVGNIVQAAPALRLRLVHTAYERARAYPYLWTHLLGQYPNQNVLALRLRGSCDASTWLAPVRWQPSWRGWTMLRTVANYPPAMWSHTDSEGYERNRGFAMCYNTSAAVQATLTAVREDTHRV